MARFERHETGPVSIVEVNLTGLEMERCVTWIGGNRFNKRVEDKMKNHTLVYWKSEKFYVGKLLECPEIMTQGETIEELEANIKDAYIMMYMDGVPDDYQVKEISL